MGYLDRESEWNAHFAFSDYADNDGLHEAFTSVAEEVMHGFNKDCEYAICPARGGPGFYRISVGSEHPGWEMSRRSSNEDGIDCHGITFHKPGVGALLFVDVRGERSGLFREIGMAVVTPDGVETSYAMIANHNTGSSDPYISLLAVDLMKALETSARKYTDQQTNSELHKYQNFLYATRI